MEGFAYCHGVCPGCGRETIVLMTDRTEAALGVYVSIPFCRSKCTYCNFASGVYPASQQDRYVSRLIEDLRGAAEWAVGMGVELPRRVDTVYLGGGTPSLLAPELITSLFAGLHNALDIDPDAEITMECAPGQLAEPALEAMVAVGVNRVSLGVQSFVDREAQTSGRLHSRATVEEDLHRLRQAGITNLNVDLIAGLAGQTMASWEQSLAALAESAVPHASVYMLEVDEESRLGRELLAGGARYHAGLVPSDEAIARMYERAIECLGEVGSAQYEISNFSRPGFLSRHNLRYWERRPYLGVGLDASSMLRAAEPLPGEVCDVLRSKTTDDLAAYLAGPQRVETTWLSPEQQHEEAWFLGLRLIAGVNVYALESQFGPETVEPVLSVIGRLAEDGLVHVDGATVRLTAQGRLLSNDVFQEFLGLASESTAGR
jgi:putative oxygen-independent coproporphyrinogen III oxidase